MVEALSNPNLVEQTSSPEIKPEYKLVNVGTIAIFGEEGAGKTVLSEELAHALNARLLQGGQIVREISGGTHGTIGYLERPLSVDKNFDQQQIDLMREADPEDPLINESKLSGLMIRINPDIKAVAICVTAPAAKRISRIRKRALKEWQLKKDTLFEDFTTDQLSQEEFEIVAEHLIEERENLTVAKIHEEEKQRRVEDIRQWSQVWPVLGGRDPLNPGTVINGKKLYDITVSTGKKTKAETLQFVFDKLIELGYLKKI